MTDFRKTAFYILLMCVFAQQAMHASVFDWAKDSRWYTSLTALFDRGVQDQFSVLLNRSFTKKPLSYDEFAATHTEFIATQKKMLQQPELWTQHTPLNLEACDEDGFVLFQPFTQKVIVSASSRVYIWGDLHGDLATLKLALHKLQKEGVLQPDGRLQPNTYMLFLGDYVDRGQEGVEVLYILMKLKTWNPRAVFMSRGNHENLTYNCRPQGFYFELKRKFPEQLDELLKKSHQLYSSLPAGIFLGAEGRDTKTTYVLCCHGALDLGYDPHALLADHEKQFDRIMKLPCLTHLHAFQSLDPQLPLTEGSAVLKKIASVEQKPELHIEDLSMLWGDFKARPGATALTTFNPKSRRGITYGENLTKKILEFYSAGDSWHVVAVIRGHQHNPSMPGLWKNKKNAGVYRQPWDVPIFTTVATNSMTHTDTQGCFLKIVIEQDFTAWRLEHYYLRTYWKYPYWDCKKANLIDWDNNDNPVKPNVK